MVLKSRTGRYLPWVCVALFGGAVLRTHPEWILSSLAQPTAGDGPAAPNDVPAAADNPAYQKYYQQFLSQGYDAQTAATYAQKSEFQGFTSNPDDQVSLLSNLSLRELN